MKRLVTDLNFDEQETAAMTRQLPTITMTLIRASTESDKSSLGSPQLTSSRSAAHADAFSIIRITFALLLQTPTTSSSEDGIR